MDVDHRAVAHNSPDFINLFVGDRDTAIRPVSQAVILADPAISVGQSMNEDIASRRRAELVGVRAIFRIGIGNVDGFVELAVAIPAI